MFERVPGKEEVMIDLTGVMFKDYYLFRRVSLGEVADVYCAYASRLEGTEVAVKVFRPGYARHRVARHYFLSESRKIGLLQHQNILPLLAYGEEQGLLYMVTPFIITGTLSDLLGRVGGRFSMIQALPILQQVSDAVQYAHEHEVLHGNLKPSNIFVSQDGRMLLADFGIACGYSEQQQELTRVGWGSADYAAPEQSLGVLRRSSDIYALGVLLFRLLTGYLPFVGQSPVEVLNKHVHQAPPSLCDYDPSFPRTVDAVVRRALSKRAEERFASARELSSAFHQAVMTEHALLTLSPSLTPHRGEPFTATRLLRKEQMKKAEQFAPELAQEQPKTEVPLTVAHEARPPFGSIPLPEQELERAFPEQGMAQALPALGRQSPILARPDFWHKQDYQDASLLFAADPAEWSPLMTALAALEPGASAHESSSPPSSDAISINEAPPNEEQETASRTSTQPWLPLLVLLLLLLGLLGALFSAFYFPNG